MTGRRQATRRFRATSRSRSGPPVAGYDIIWPVKITIIHPYDPGADYASGIRTAISGFIRTAPETWAIRVIGCTADPNSRPVGRPVDLRLGTRNIEFLPIVSGHPAQRPLIPMSLRFTLQLLRRRRHLDLRDAYLIFHRLESAWPFLNLPNRKLMFLHYGVHSHVFDPRSPVRWRRLPRVYLALQKRVLSRIDWVRSPSSMGVAWLSRRHPDLADRIAFSPSFVDSELFTRLPDAARREIRTHLASILGIDPAAPLALFIGRFDPQKDPLLAVRAWRALVYEGVPPILVFVGQGELEPQIRTLVRSEGLEGRVRFAGNLPSREVVHWMNAADLLLMTSIYEAMSMAMLEALKCGLPVVASGVGETTRLICRPEAGRVVSERSPAAFACAIADVLEQPRDPERCALSAEPYSPERVLRPIFATLAGDEEAIR